MIKMFHVYKTSWVRCQCENYRRKVFSEIIFSADFNGIKLFVFKSFNSFLVTVLKLLIFILEETKNIYNINDEFMNESCYEMSHFMQSIL